MGENLLFQGSGGSIPATERYIASFCALHAREDGLPQREYTRRVAQIALRIQGYDTGAADPVPRDPAFFDEELEPEDDAWTLTASDSVGTAALRDPVELDAWGQAFPQEPRG